MNKHLVIGARLTAERARLGFTQETLGAALGLTRVTQGSYERGRSSPSADYLARVAGLGFDVLYIVTGTRAPLATHQCECVLPASLLINCQSA